MGKDFQRTLLWVILGASLFMLWDNYQVYTGGQSVFHSSTHEQTAETTAAEVPSTGTVAAVNATQSAAEKAVKPVEVTTDRMKVTFDLEGARIVRSEMLMMPRQPDWTEVGLAGLVLGRKPAEDLGNLVLFETTPTRTYVAQTGLVGGDYPNHRTEYRLVSQAVDMKDADKLDIVFEADKGGLKVTKTFSFTRGNYGVEVKTDIENVGQTPATPSIYYQITRDGGKPEGESSMYSTFTGAAVYSNEEKFQKIDYADIADKSATYQGETDNGWVAMIQHHFVSAWVPEQGEKRENYANAIDKNLYSIGTLVKLPTVEPGKTISDKAELYAGPQAQERLEQIAPGLELVVDYGWLTFLAKPIYWLLSFLHGIVGNWGWAIVLLTCIVKAILYPISAAGYRSMARMKEVTPRMKAIQEKYKDDKQRLNQAMMELYQREKINPVGGCLPIFLQIPVFLALYWVLQGSVELRGSEWILWVHDLAMPDPWFVLPALMAATMFLQIFLNPKPTDPVQARMMYIMPVVFSVMFFVFASGLVLYWLTNNVLSIAQQWWINKTIAAQRAANLK